MSKSMLVGVVLLAAAAASAAGAFSYARTTGLSALATPSAAEARVARAVRRLAISSDVRERENPVPPSDEALAEGRTHFADHCAACHANNGSGDTEMGRNLFPKAPDMRLPATQELTDGELFWVIENGIRFTGMPGWSTGTKDGEAASWQLVHFIRRLPALTQAEIDEMETLNPRSPAEIQQEIEAERFLRGDDDVTPSEHSAHGR
jgi:mono/diheme cytochrome c family protein